MTEIPQGDDVEAAERVQMSASETAWAIREVTRRAADIDVALARRLHLRPLDYAALNHVMTSTVPLGPAELSTRLGISSGSGTELVDRLERAGHLERQRDHADRRRVSLRASPTAVRAVLGELGPLVDGLGDLEAGLTPQERATVIRYLRATAAHMTKYVQHLDDTV